MIVDSSSKTEQNVFLTFIRKKESGDWEKPSVKEGKKINLNLEELVWVLEVLRRKELEWSTVHKFEDITTNISVSWGKDQKEREKLIVQVDGYTKYLNYAESIVLTMLFEHLLEEKIIHSTIPMKREQEIPSREEELSRKPEVKVDQSKMSKMVVEEVISKKKKKGKQKEEGSETTTITGMIQGETEKALRILFETGQEAWIPKSTIHSSYSSAPEEQEFIIETWMLKKNGITKE